MAQTTNKYQIIQKTSTTDTVVLHPETQADVVLYDGTTSGIDAKNMQEAVDTIESEVKAIQDGGVVTGIKGNNETEYRKGNVNLTAEDIGAEKQGSVDKHNTDTTVHQDIRDAINAAQERADNAYALADGRSRAVTYDTVAEMTTALKNASNTDFKVGDSLFIKDTQVPDYWVSNVLDNNQGEYGYYEICESEVAKVDLTDYQQKTDAKLNTTDKTIVGGVNEVLAKANANNAAINTNAEGLAKVIDGRTKIASAANADKATTAESTPKWEKARTLGVSVNSGKKSDGSVITATASQNVDGSEDKTIAVTLGDSGVQAGTYSAIQVNEKGVAIAGGQMMEIGVEGQDTPSNTLATGGLFFKVI